LSIADDLKSEVKAIFATRWAVREGDKVPETEDIKLGNDAVKLSATVLYADLADSTDLVQDYKPAFAGEIYKSFLVCACRIIREEGGVITAFDGDRVMGVFIGDPKNTPAAKAALKITYAVREIVNPALKEQYPTSPYVVRHGVGVDTSDIFVARAGIRGSNDLVWVGRAANYAAKLCSLRNGSFTSWITSDVYQRLNEDARIARNGQPMWEARTWTERNITVYRSSWQWQP
jgi:class 3 adenylate cyclase